MVFGRDRRVDRCVFLFGWGFFCLVFVFFVWLGIVPPMLDPLSRGDRRVDRGVFLFGWGFLFGRGFFCLVFVFLFGWESTRC